MKTLLSTLAFLVVVTGVGAATEFNVTLNSKSAIVIDYHSGRVLFEHEADERLPPASVTKTMTLILALEALHAGDVGIDDLVPTSAYAASMGGTQIWLEPGEQMPFGQLLSAIAVGSANDASVAVAEFLAGSERAFADRMNERARELGATNTHFSNASGLPPTSIGGEGPHVTTARDLAIMSRHALTIPGFSDLVSTWGPVVMRPSTQQKPVLWNFNEMLKTYPGMDGIKTGMTSDAGFCLAASAKRDHLRLIAVTLGAATKNERDGDVRRLLDEGFRLYQALPVVHEGIHVTDAPVLKGKYDSLRLAAADDFSVTVRKDDVPEITTVVEIDDRIVAPIKQGEVVARLVVYSDGDQAGMIPLVAMDDMERASLSDLFKRYFSKIVSVVGEEKPEQP